MPPDDVIRVISDAEMQKKSNERCFQIVLWEVYLYSVVCVSLPLLHQFLPFLFFF